MTMRDGWRDGETNVSLGLSGKRERVAFDA